MYCPNCGTEVHGATCQTCGATINNSPSGSAKSPTDSKTGLVLSGWWRRVGATLVDGIILSAIGVVIRVIFPATFASLLAVALQAAYLIYLISRDRGQTIGNRAVSTQVRSAVDGGAVSQRQSVIRWAVVGVPSIFIIIAPLLGILFALFELVDVLFPLWDERNQTIHDKLADTVVVIAPPNI